MKEVGIFLICIAAIMGYFAFDMDTSVSAGSYSSSIASDRVVNLGKMNNQQNYLITSSALGIMGCILLVGGVIEKQLTKLQISSPVTTESNQKFVTDKSNDFSLSPEQKELKAKYGRSEISFEEYIEEWNKLS
jgi:hypothetical protein